VRICHVITRLIVGGAQENTLLTCRELHSRGHQVVLVTGPETGPEGSMLEQAGADGYEVTVVRGMRRAVSWWGDWQAFCRLREVLSQLRPDVVHTHSSKAGILGRRAARDVGVPIIVHTIHGMSFNRTQAAPVRWLYGALERYCAGFTDRFVCVADAMTRQAVEARLGTTEDFVTIRSGIELEGFNPELYHRASVRERLGLPAEAIVVASIARLSDNKGYEQLIPAMAKAARREPKLFFLWIGGGANRVRYERRLADLGLADRVHLTGLVEPDTIAELLAGSDMLVHTSRWEGLPRAAVQALLMCRPVVCFDIDGAPEVVRHDKTGLLVGLGDVDDVAEAMCALAADGERRDRLGRAGRRLCLEQFDYRRMVDRIERLYLELADAKL
jgi:glycosyltransferase involved in cell wall biosynthesis